MVKAYYQLLKPGIIYGNAITATAGFFLAARGNISWGIAGLFVAMLFGLSLVIGGACVANNVIDRDIDDKMQRTKNRAIVQGTVTSRNATIFSIILLLGGSALLGLLTNLLTLAVVIAGFIVYVFIYTPAKRNTVHSTLIGAVAGAVAPVAGYVAVSNRLDGGAGILFLILVFWQLPHFFAIGIRRLEDYRSASLPILPVTRGVRATKNQMLAYMCLFIISTILLFIFKYAGLFYLVTMVVLDAVWLWLLLRGFKKHADTAAEVLWARKFFLFSLLLILLFSISIVIDSLIK